MAADPSPTPEHSPDEAPRSSPPAAESGYGLVARRVSSWTTNLVLSGLIVVLGLGLGRQVLQWWADDVPNAGLIVVQDAETGEQLYVDTGNPEFRRRFLQAAERREATLKTDLQRAGVDLFSMSTEEDLVGAIVHMAAMRKRKRR